MILLYDYIGLVCTIVELQSFRVILVQINPTNPCSMVTFRSKVNWLATVVACHVKLCDLAAKNFRMSDVYPTYNFMGKQYVTWQVKSSLFNGGALQAPWAKENTRSCLCSLALRPIVGRKLFFGRRLIRRPRFCYMDVHAVGVSGISIYFDVVKV